MEQKKLIQNKVMGHGLIKGVAGSGKTTVAVGRIPFLLEHYCYDESDKILMVTFNKSLTHYIEYIYSMMDVQEQMSLFSLPDAKQDRLKIVNIDKIIYSYFSKACREKYGRLDIVSEQQKNQYLMRGVSTLADSYGDVKFMDPQYLGFLKKEIAWIKACNYRELEEYQTVDRLGRTSAKNVLEPQKLFKNSRTRQAIFELMGLYTQRMLKEGKCDFEDIALIALDYMQNHEADRYTHIIIDESQDLSRTQLECLLKLYNREKSFGSLLFVTDTAQSIYSTAWLVKGRNFTSIGLDMTGKSNSLAKNYRTTTQIAEIAYSLIQKDKEIVGDDNFVTPSLIDRQGCYPVLRGFRTLEEELCYIMELIRDKLSKQYHLKDIAVVSRVKRILEDACSLFGSEVECSLYNASSGIDFKKEDVKLLTMHSIKGLEFKVVILLGLSEKVIPNRQAISSQEDAEYLDTMERKLLYVGMTRATERLYMSYHGEPSKFLKEMDYSLLKINDESKIRNFYQIPLERYLFKEKLADLYGKEERVRQWFIKELLETYRYPLSLLEIEFEVQAFSKTGYVDIVVKIYRNYEMVPYIMIEAKPFGTDLERAHKQLESYMAVTPKCCYGVLCNGNEFLVQNREGERVDDIPSFDLSMLPSAIERFEYRNLLSGRRIDFLMDGENREEVIVEQDGIQEVFKGDRLCGMPVFTSIAAGEPILLVEERTDVLNMPCEWFGSHEDLFVLNVKGNSMVDAGIDNGDQIVIRKQPTADSGQIAAVEIDGNTTLKRIRKMGSLVLLIPENQEYEPIAVNAEQVRVIGIAVGLIKPQNARQEGALAAKAP